MKIEQVRTVAVIGTGTMGAGFSLCFAQVGFDVHVFDISAGQLENARTRIRSCQQVLITEGVLSEEDAQKTRERIKYFTDLGEAVVDAQYIMEAVPENLELKRKVFKQIDEACQEDAVRVTTTSGLSVSAVTKDSRRPELTAGMHWVNPPELVPLVEIIRGEKTSPETIDLIYKITEKLEKKPVLIQKEVPGIGLNRLQFALFREAVAMVEEGVVSAEDIDRIMCYGLGFRFPWIGPLKTADLGGLDVFLDISSYLFKYLNDAKAPSQSLKDLVAQGHLGVKSGQGFYDYQGKTAAQILSRRDRSFIRQWRLMQDIEAEEEPGKE